VTGVLEIIIPQKQYLVLDTLWPCSYTSKQSLPAATKGSYIGQCSFNRVPVHFPISFPYTCKQGEAAPRGVANFTD